MPFHLQPIREFLVRPTLPASLPRLSELAHNLLWSWEPIVRALFRRLDPALWRECGYNPVLMLGRVPQATLARLGADARYLVAYRTACETYDARVRKGPPPADGKLIALSGDGELSIAPASPDGFKPTARAKVLGPKCWTAPVLANGLVYCRNSRGEIAVIDLRVK